MLFVWDWEREDIAHMLCSLFKPDCVKVEVWYESLGKIYADFITEDTVREFVIAPNGRIYDVFNQRGCGVVTTIQELINIISKRLEVTA